MHLMWVMQAHHIDTDYSDKFFGPGDYGPAHAAHMANWLRGGRPHAYRRVMRVATRGSASVEDQHVSAMVTSPATYSSSDSRKINYRNLFDTRRKSSLASMATPSAI